MLAKVIEVKEVRYFEHRTNPKTASVWAKGTVPTSGWGKGVLSPHIYVNPPADGIQDFDFLAEAPPADTITLQVVSEVDAMWFGAIPSWTKGVRIHASQNSMEAGFGDSAFRINSQDLTFGGEIPWPLLVEQLGDEIPWPFSLAGSDLSFRSK